MYSTPPLPKVCVLGLKKILITLAVRDVVFFSRVSHFPTDTKDRLKPCVLFLSCAPEQYDSRHFALAFHTHVHDIDTEIMVHL